MRVASVIMLTFLAASPAFAGDAASGIQDLSRSGLHYDALLRANTVEGALTLGDELALARSSWALGLVDGARSHWDNALANRDFQGAERTKEKLARTILELQEGNYEKARALSEQTAGTLPPSDLRAQFWIVVAESLKLQNAYGQAEGYYRRAVEESSRESKTEPLYLLGECQLKLGMINDARYSFASVSSPSKYASPALRRLTEIDLIQKNFDGVLLWISEGRENYPGEFEDPWVGFAEASAYAELGRFPEARRALNRIRVRHSENHPWFAIAAAQIEARERRSSLDKKGEGK